MSDRLIILKQRIYNRNMRSVNSATLASKTARHIIYIGTRPGVMRKPDMTTGLFGSINNQYKSELNMSEACSAAKIMVEGNKTIYRCVLSLTDIQAAEYGLDSCDKWQELAKSQILIIAKENGIKLEHLDWTAAVHQKDGHPHIHFCFWDRSHAIQKLYVSENKVKDVRQKIINNMYASELKEFYKEKDLTAKEIRTNANELFEKAEKYIASQIGLSETANMQFGDYQKLVDVNSGLTITDISDAKNIATLLSGFMEIKRHMVEKGGSMKYGSLSAEDKKMIDEYVKSVIQSSEKLQMIADRFVTANINIAEFYNTSEEKILERQKAATSDILKMVGNNLLKAMKEMGTGKELSEKLLGSVEYEADDNGVDEVAYQQAYICNTFFQIFSSLVHMTKQRNEQSAHLRIAGDLSKAALKEIAKERRDRGIGVDY